MKKSKILSYLLGPVGSGILGLVSLPIITWFYSVEDIGKISMLQVFSSFMTLLFCLGLDQAYVREYHESKIKQRLFKASFLPGFTLLLICSFGLYFSDETLLSNLLYKENNKYLTILSLLCFVLAFCSRFLSLILRMEERAIAYSMSQLLPKISFLTLILCIVWLGFKTNFYSLILAHSLSITLVFFVFAWNTRLVWLRSLSQMIDIEELKKLLHFGLPLVIGGLAAWGLNVMDKLSIRALSTFSELGVYSVTISIAAVATVFSSVFNIIWAPLVFKWVSEKSVCFNKIDMISEHLLAAIFFIIVISGLLSWLLPLLLPKEYGAVEYLITTCLIGPLFYTLSETTAVGITIARKTYLAMFASLTAMIVNGVGNYFLVPIYGAAGAAVSTAVSFWFFYIIRTELSRRVWRNIPSGKSYLAVTLIVFITILNTLYLRGSKEILFIWGGLLFFGLFFFRQSRKALLEQVVIKFA